MRENGNINFVLIGAKATGKTVYLASIYLNLKNITSQNGKTIEYLKPLANNLLDGEYPQATAGSLHELMFNYKDDEFTSHIQIDDVDGYFVESMHKSDEATQKQRDTLLHNIKNSEGIIFFFPYEESFNEESIKNFNYEIDTIISQLKKMYKDRSDIPIPAVIAVAKWDRSPDYKTADEDIKSIEYIESNKFLKLAKEKIEQNFSKLQTIPLSSVGKNIEQMKPYNLEKPIQFFLRETYKIWDKKIESLKDNKRGSLKFLSKVHFDMKFYKGGRYNKIYDVLEKEFTEEILSKLKTIENHSQFLTIEEEYKDVIPFLKKEHKEQIEDIGKQFRSKKTRKTLAKSTVFGLVLAAVLLTGSAWYIKSKLMKSESELFSDLSVEYKNHNYKDAMKDLEQYQALYKDTLDVEHKNKVEEIRGGITDYYSQKFQEILKFNSLQKQYDSLKALYEEVQGFDEGMDIVSIKSKYDEISILKEDYQKVLSFTQEDISDLANITTILRKLSDYHFVEVSQSKNILEKILIAMANNIVNDVELDDTDNIDDLLSAFANLGLNSPDTVQKLTDKKNAVQTNNLFDALKNNIENKNFKRSIEVVESNWDSKFNENKKSIIKNILDKKANIYIENLLKKVSDITDFDEYNKLVDVLTEINELPKKTVIGVMGYKLVLTSRNYNEFTEKHDLEKKYHKIIHKGINRVKVFFGTKYEDNNLGFECGDHKIELEIEMYKYIPENIMDCVDRTVNWAGSIDKIFKSGEYRVKVTEVDLLNNDHYDDGFFTLEENDLIKISNNNEDIKKDIGDNYFIIFRGQ